MTSQIYFTQQELDAAKRNGADRVMDATEKGITLKSKFQPTPQANGKIVRMYCKPFEDSSECERYYEMYIKLGETTLIRHTADIPCMGQTTALATFMQLCMDAVDGIAILANGGSEEEAFRLLGELAERDAQKIYLRRAVSAITAAAVAKKEQDQLLDTFSENELASVNEFIEKAKEIRENPVIHADAKAITVGSETRCDSHAIGRFRATITVTGPTRAFKVKVEDTEPGNHASEHQFDYGLPFEVTLPVSGAELNHNERWNITEVISYLRSMLHDYEHAAEYAKKTVNSIHQLNVACLELNRAYAQLGVKKIDLPAARMSFIQTFDKTRK